jgi:hypothetical protein
MAERSYPHFTFCAPPGQNWRWTGGDYVGILFTSFLAGAGLAFVEEGIIAAIFGGGLGVSCLITIGVIWAGILGIYTFDDWYYHHRLMCIKERQCTVGTLVGTPHISEDDGDQKYDVLLAPFTIPETEQLFRDVIAEHPEQYGVGPTDPGSQALGQYISGYLTEKEQISLYMRVVREKMITQPGRDFQKKFWIRIKEEMGDAQFDHTNDDTFAVTDPDPIFRYDPNSHLAPYLHQELEGDKLHRWLMNLVAGLWTALVAATATCAICNALGGGKLCDVLTPIIAALLWFLAYLIAQAVNDPDDGNANQTDVGFSDPAFDGDRPSIEIGDVILVYGDWIHDPNHDQYVELHPVRAIYMICRDPKNPDQWQALDDLTGFPRDECRFPVDTITSDMKDEMCMFVDQAENPDDTGVILLRKLDHRRALSMAGGLR